MNNDPNPHYDALVIGAGHNALVCAAYLARAGQRVGVFEKADVIGGASATKELFPGYSFDIGASAHSFIHLTPIMSDLELDRYGLHYIDLDPFFFMPFPDHSYLALWRSVEQTCEEIARVSPSDAENYRRFCRDWTPLAQVMADLMMTSPTPVSMSSAAMRSLLAHRGWKVSRLPMLRLSMRQFLDATFQSGKVKAMLGWIAAQVGLSPDMPGGAIFVIWPTIYHVCGITIPRGGSGMLAQALARYIEERGGQVYANEPVSQIRVENGQAVGIETANGQQFHADIVVSGAHIKTTARLLGQYIPQGMERRINALKTNNGGGVQLHIAAKGLPVYQATSESLSHTAIQLIAPTMDYVAAAWRDYQQGAYSANPLLSVMTHSASDASRSPTISIWAQYYPYEFKNGTIWNNTTRDQIIDSLLDTVADYAPNIRDVVVDMCLETPAFFEAELGMIGGDIQHIHVTFDQMFMLRPGLAMSHYKTPIRQLFLTGASTHPSGGITGMPGWNAAREILG